MTDIIVSLITAGLSLVGVIITVLLGNKKSAATMKSQTDLTIYRICELEKKVEKHNSVIERVFKLEEHEAVVDEKLKVANRRIKDLEQFHTPPHN